MSKIRQNKNRERAKIVNNKQSERKKQIIYLNILQRLFELVSQLKEILRFLN